MNRSNLTDCLLSNDITYYIIDFYSAINIEVAIFFQLKHIRTRILNRHKHYELR